MAGKKKALHVVALELEVKLARGLAGCGYGGGWCGVKGRGM